MVPFVFHLTFVCLKELSSEQNFASLISLSKYKKIDILCDTICNYYNYYFYLISI